VQRSDGQKCYSTQYGVSAEYAVDQSGKVTTIIHFGSSIKFRAVYAGYAQTTFQWVYEGKSSHWQFSPKIVEPKTANYTIVPSSDGRESVTIDSDEFHPCIGFARRNLSGVFFAPAIHFDIRLAYDIWIFLLHSPWLPLKISVEKSSLSVTHDSSQATADFTTLEQQQFPAGVADRITGDLTCSGTSFLGATLTLNRMLLGYSSSETIGNISGNETSPFAWTPAARSFDSILICNSELWKDDLAFLGTLGGDNSSGLFTGAKLNSDFTLGDDPEIAYSLVLTGHRHFTLDKDDRTTLSLALA
jgi:hypothetical protein